MTKYSRLARGVCAVLIFGFSSNTAFAGGSICLEKPVSADRLDCSILKREILYAVRHKYQSVDLDTSGSAAAQNDLKRDATALYKEFLRWTAQRDRTTIGNLLSDEKRGHFEPRSFQGEGYAVTWLNVPSIDEEAYFDEFWAQHSGQVTVTLRPASSSLSVLRD